LNTYNRIYDISGFLYGILLGDESNKCQKFVGLKLKIYCKLLFLRPAGNKCFSRRFWNKWVRRLITKTVMLPLKHCEFDLLLCCTV